ncbi:MAG: glycosyl hydrolase [Ginsengibacter sp.]
MKKFILYLLSAFIFNNSLNAQTFVTSVEAETGVLTGVYISAQTGSSSGPFVTGFDNNGDNVTVNVTVPAASYYKLEIRYRATNGNKNQRVLANNIFVGEVVFPAAADFVDLNAGSIYLNSGINTITVEKSWGYMDVDKFSIYTIPPNVFDITPTLIDNKLSAATKHLYKYLRTQFGTNIISGSTDDQYENVKTQVGKSPLLRAWDFASYSPMYPWKWGGSGHIFGPVDNQDAEHAISWYNGTGKKGIVAIHWHWGSPSGGTAGTNTFYTNLTTFDVSQAVINGTQQNIDVIRDIDAIAVQLKKLQDADVPVLWRPLHEAGGAWFWWGAKGSGPAKAMWDIVYQRLHDYHGLHNLIWVWSTPEADWYPGNSKTDLIGYDSYPGEFNYTPQKNLFDNLYTITGGKKLIAMSENGPIPDINNSLSSGAFWSYFMTWSDLAFSQNTPAHMTDVYNNAKTITLENYVAVLPVTISGFAVKKEKQKARIEWTSQSEQNNDHFEISRSSNGKDFILLSKIKAHDTAGSADYLTYDDQPFAGTNYYKLTQFDIDGRATIYAVKTIDFDATNLSLIKIYPNPSTRNISMHLKSYKGNKVIVSMRDVTGKTIYQQSIATNHGQDIYKLSFKSSVSPGLYLLTIEGEKLKENISVVLR